jgi:hypothetical protein
VKLPAVAGAQPAHHLRQSPPSKLLHVEKRRAGCILLPQTQYFNTFFEIFSKNIPNGRFLPAGPCNYSLKYRILLEQKCIIEHLFFYAKMNLAQPADGRSSSEYILHVPRDSNRSDHFGFSFSNAVVEAICLPGLQV